jgi:hypothetical protein
MSNEASNSWNDWLWSMFDARFAKYLNDPERDLHDLMVDVCEETLALAERARDEAPAETVGSLRSEFEAKLSALERRAEGAEAGTTGPMIIHEQARTGEDSSVGCR